MAMGKGVFSGPIPGEGGARFEKLFRGAAWLASRGGRRGSLLILLYHRVLETPDALLGLEPDAHAFAAQMDLVSAVCNVLSLTEAVERLAAHALPPRALAITFDDGYVNNLEVAAPILAARRLPATVFISTGFTAGGCMFNDVVIEALRVAPQELALEDLGLGRFALTDDRARAAAIHPLLNALKYRSFEDRRRATEAIAERCGLTAMPRLMMDERQLRRLASFGVELGAHCVTHPILARLDSASARDEIVTGKRELEEILGTNVRGFAYPNGHPGADFLPEHVQMVREAGFEFAVSTAWGAAGANESPYELPRIRLPHRLIGRLRQRDMVPARSRAA